jgi:hypothetical protein
MSGVGLKLNLIFSNSFVRKSLILVLTTSPFVQAEIANPARDIHAINSKSVVTPVDRVKTARIAIVDYDLIKKDFPSLAEKSNAEIDHWILSHTAFISQTQTRQTQVNSQIEVGLEKKTAFRPPDYKRALVFEVAGGMIDGKGFGSSSPYQGDHSNGLATLGEVIREFLYQKMVQKIFDYTGFHRSTVGSYAVLDWGFRVKHSDGTTSPAGAILRQAHRRAGGKSSLLDDQSTLEVETLLRKFGVTSAGAYRERSTEMLNIQGTQDGAIIDFGGYLVVEKFDKMGTPFYGSKVIIQPGSTGWTQPHSELRIPFEIWGTSVSKKEDPKADNPWIWSHELAEAFASQKAHRGDVENHYRNLLDPVKNKLRSMTLNQCALSLSQ